MSYRILPILAFLFTQQLSAAVAYPDTPHENVTPGSYCETPDQFRYPEKIKYCERDVSTETKHEVIRMYEERFGYKIMQTGRQKFKIDHLIPLCMGGSNEVSNLWPQHESIYRLTDPLESEGCELLANGDLKQKEVIELLLEAKRQPEKSQEILGIMHGRPIKK